MSAAAELCCGDDIDVGECHGIDGSNIGFSIGVASAGIFVSRLVGTRMAMSADLLDVVAGGAQLRSAIDLASLPTKIVIIWEYVCAVRRGVEISGGSVSDWSPDASSSVGGAVSFDVGGDA